MKRIWRYAKFVTVFCLALGFTGCICMGNDERVFEFDEKTGFYVFTDCDTETFIFGMGVVKRKGSTITLEDSQADRRVTVKVDLTRKRGVAGVQIFDPSRTFTIEARTITQSEEACPIPCIPIPGGD